MNQNFLIILGLVRTNTLSPNNDYYYKIKEPYSLNPSAFGCKAAFFSLPDGILNYYNSNAVLHELHLKEEIDTKYQEMLKKKTFDAAPKEYLLDFVWWSQQGNLCYFLEYGTDKNFVSVFLNLKEQRCYRIDENQNNFVIVDNLHLVDRAYNEVEILKKLQSNGLHQQPLIKDKIPEQGFWDKLMKRNKWHPE